MKPIVALNYFVLTISMALAIGFVTGGLTIFTDQLNMKVFQRKNLLSAQDKFWLIRTLGLWTSIFLFTFSVLVMLFRIVSGKTNPSTERDPQLINTFNRIISNSIEQGFIFAGLFGNILFDVDQDHKAALDDSKMLAIASLFVVGRLAYALGYTLATITKISTLRSFGFAVGLQLNVIMIAQSLNIDSIAIITEHLTPIVKSKIA